MFSTTSCDSSPGTPPADNSTSTLRAPSVAIVWMLRSLWDASGRKIRRLSLRETQPVQERVATAASRFRATQDRAVKSREAKTSAAARSADWSAPSMNDRHSAAVSVPAK